MIQACLGLGFDPEQSRITFEEPAMPDFLHEVTLRNLAMEGRSADVTLRRWARRWWWTCWSGAAASG